MRRWRYLAIKVLLLLPVLLLSATALWARAGGAGGGGGGDSGGGGDGFAGDIIGAIFGLILELAVEYPPFGIALVITIAIFWLIIRYYNKKPN